MSKRIFCLLPVTLIFLLSSLSTLKPCYGQGTVVDSLRRVALNTTGVNRYEALYGMARDLYLTKADTAIILINQAIAEASEINDSLRIGKAYRVLVIIYNRIGRSRETLPILKKIEQIYQRLNFHDEDQRLYTTFGMSFQLLGQYENAISSHLKVFEVSKRTGDVFYMGAALNNIGFIHYKIKNYSLAEKFFREALVYYNQDKEKDISDISRTTVNIGLSLVYQNKIEEGKKLIVKVLGDINRYKHSTDIPNEARGALGICYYLEKDYASAKKQFAEVLVDLENIGYHRYVVEIYLFQIRIALQEHDLKEAARVIDLAKKLAIKNEYTQLLMDVVREEIELVKYSRQDSLIYSTQMRYLNLRDSVVGNDISATLLLQTKDLANNIQRADSPELNGTLNINILLLIIITALAGIFFSVGLEFQRSKKINSNFDQIIKSA